MINVDETPLKIVPVDKWTLEREGSKQVPVVGLEDKREITGLLGCTLSGRMLPPQLIYEGKTERCHPSFTFPEKWDIWHSESHWCTHTTMTRYVEMVLEPWLECCREELALSPTQRALVVLDVYKAHRTSDVLGVLKEAGFELVFVPGNCTSELQPLDVAVNSRFKAVLKERFTVWYADRVQSAIRSHPSDVQDAIESVQPDLRLSVMKPLHAQWITEAFDTVQQNTDIVRNGWLQSGITSAFRSAAVSDTNISPPAVQLPLSPAKISATTSNIHPVTLGPSRKPSTFLASEMHHVDGLAFNEHYFQPELSQSRIDGQNGSSACTLIAALTSHRVLTGVLPLNTAKGAYPLSRSLEEFLSCIRQGNYIYDSAQLRGLLSVDQALTSLSHVPVRVQCELFLTAEKGWNHFIVSSIQAAETSSVGLAAGVLVTSPYAVMVAASSTGCLYVFDSHSHGKHGALVAVSSCTATNGNMATYLARFFSNKFGLGSSLTLSNGSVVNREFQFVFLAVA